jgi:hypothetical protein
METPGNSLSASGDGYVGMMEPTCSLLTSLRPAGTLSLTVVSILTLVLDMVSTTPSMYTTTTCTRTSTLIRAKLAEKMAPLLASSYP